MDNPIFKYQKYVRNRIDEVEKLMKIYPNNKMLPILRRFLFNDLLYTQMKYFDRGYR